MSGIGHGFRGRHTSRIKKIIRKRKKMNIHVLPVLLEYSSVGKVFAEFVKSKQLEGRRGNSDSNLSLPSWLCCDKTFAVSSEIHKHVARTHSEAVDELLTFELSRVTGGQKRVEEVSEPAKGTDGRNHSGKWCEDEERASRNGGVPQTGGSRDCVLPWVPSQEQCDSLGSQSHGDGQILLYYNYVDIQNPSKIADWQRELCQSLGLTGKIRLASEGMNGTVGGSKGATELYAQATMKHPLFQTMTSQDFKRSSGDASHFPRGLKVGVFQEIVPMGVDPNVLSYKEADSLKRIEACRAGCVLENAIAVPSKELIDPCWQGQFEGAVTPDIRKFSYWPEYVDKNLDLFRDKRVVMYCTGGIRCERGSAYLKSKGICKEIFQLQGGIHRYLEEYPHGYFKGKLFVFDDRYTIKTNDQVVADCFHCGRPWDQYRPCSSAHCHQLVLACPDCRDLGKSACCALCGSISRQASATGRRPREECLCTQRRARVPLEGQLEASWCLDERAKDSRVCTNS